MISSLANSSTWPDVSHGLDFKCSKWLDPLLLMKQILRFQRFFSRDFMRVATSHGSHNLIPWKMATLSSVFWHSKPLRIKQSLNQNSGKKSWPVRSQTLRSKYVHVWFKWLMVLEMITECLQGPGVTCQEKVVPAIQRSIQNILCLQWRGLPGYIYTHTMCILVLCFWPFAAQYCCHGVTLIICCSFLLSSFVLRSSLFYHWKNISIFIYICI